MRGIRRWFGLAASIGLLAGCASISPAGTAAGTITAVGAESQYANVVGQIGGRYVNVHAVMSNPNIDPHSFEASASVARLVGAAGLVVQNGLGYDAFMNDIESGAPNPSRRIIDVQRLLRLPNSTRNPHLWYEPSVMPLVAKAIASALSALAPAHASYFGQRLAAFDLSLQPWFREIAAVKSRFPNAKVATTEPIADYLLTAVGANDASPWVFQADIMNGIDPSPQAVSLERGLLVDRKVKAFVYNRQVTDSLTQSLLALAKAHRIATVSMYETMPAGYDYQSWMLAETRSLARAFATGASTSGL